MTPSEPDTPEQWRKLLVDGHRPLKMAHAMFRHLPSAPRCKLCHNPFGGIGGRALRVLGYTPSRKNPNFCARCCDSLAVGGAEVDIAVVFADVRGSTTLGASTDASSYAALMNRFYGAATAALIRHDAIIDKLIGDEVMALFIRGIAGPSYRLRAVDAALDLLSAVGVGSADGAWLPLGASVHAGVAYVGNVGGEGVVDFTALGDPINVASKLQGHAAPGEVLVTDEVFSLVANRFIDAPRRSIDISGHAAVSAYAISPTG